MRYAVLVLILVFFSFPIVLAAKPFHYHSSCSSQLLSRFHAPKGTSYPEDTVASMQQGSTSLLQGQFLTESSPTWESLGPYGGEITSMAMSPDEPNIIYTAAYTNPCLIYRTSNGGAGWDLVSSISAYVNCLAVNPHLPDVVYASTWSEYVYRSTDGGGTWTGFQTNHTGNYVYALLGDPGDPDVLWGAADMHVGSYAYVAAARSTDRGSTWTFYPLSPPGWGAAYSIAIPPENPPT